MSAPILRKIILSLLMITGLLVGGMMVVKLGGSLKKEPEREDIAPPSLVVTAMALERRSVTEKLRGFGLARPMNRAAISSQVRGLVIELPQKLRVGSKVHQGDVLLKVDPTQYNARVAMAEASLAETEEELIRTQIELEETRNKKVFVEQDIEIARRELKRSDDLLAVGATSGSSRDVARSRLQLDQQRLSDTVLRERVLLAGLKKLEAVLEFRRSEVVIAESDLGYTEVKVPFDGVIEEKMINMGDLVQPGQSLFSVVSLDSLELPIEIPASKARSLKEDAPAVLETDTVPPTRISGWIERISPSITPGNRTISAYVVFTPGPEDDGVMPGVFLMASVDGRVFEDVYAIPRSAILDGDIFLNLEGVATRVAPSFFVFLDDVALTRDDLGEGNLLITSGFDRLYDGAPVRVPDVPLEDGIEVPEVDSIAVEPTALSAGV